MRDQRFVAAHRGGPLSLEHHRLLMRWACACAEHVLPLMGTEPDERLTHALAVARAWARGEATVGEARKAAVACHALAREVSSRTPQNRTPPNRTGLNQSAVFVARAVGHATATAHMADHALGPAWYGLKAVKAVGQSVEAERGWQDEQIPLEIRELVLSARESKKFAGV